MDSQGAGNSGAPTGVAGTSAIGGGAGGGSAGVIGQSGASHGAVGGVGGTANGGAAPANGGSSNGGALSSGGGFSGLSGAAGNGASTNAAGASNGGAGSSVGGVSGSSGGGASAGAGAPAGGASSTPGTGGRAGGASGGNAGAGGKITLWLAGDSTVANGNTPCPVGWGKEFDALFDERVAVTNSAVGGRSVRTWLYNVQTTMDAAGECNLQRDANGEPVVQARWQTMLNGMKAGDYLFIQFGINDGSATCDRHVGLAAFKESYGVMATAAKARGAQPVFITPVSAVACNGSTARATRGGYVTATHEAATQYDVPVIDLHAASVALYTELGFCPIPGGDVSATTGGAVGDFFCDDHTHFARPGAIEIAELVTLAIREQGLGLAAYLK